MVKKSRERERDAKKKVSRNLIVLVGIAVIVLVLLFVVRPYFIGDRGYTGLITSSSASPSPSASPSLNYSCEDLDGMDRKTPSCIITYDKDLCPSSANKKFRTDHCGIPIEPPPDLDPEEENSLYEQICKKEGSKACGKSDCCKNLGIRVMDCNEYCQKDCKVNGPYQLEEDCKKVTGTCVERDITPAGSCGDQKKAAICDCKYP